MVSGAVMLASAATPVVTSEGASSHTHVSGKNERTRVTLASPSTAGAGLGDAPAEEQGLTLVHFAAQPESFRALKTPPERVIIPAIPAINNPNTL
jgi:hypothetical protein